MAGYRPPPVRGRKVENAATTPVDKSVKAASPAPQPKAPDAPGLDLDRTRLALKRQLKILDAREKFIDFVQFTMPDPDDPSDPDKSAYDTQKHHRAIARTLQEVENGNIKRLILTLPPRAGKSELASRRFPPWLIGKDPRRHVIFATYNDTFAMDFGAEVREILYSPQYKQVFPGMGLRKGGAAKDRIQTNAGGLLVYVGRGGSITGRGADFLIIDDLFKDAEEARSPAIRDQVWSWFTKVAMTRLMSSSARVVLITTRWHEDDLIGRLIDPRGGANPHYNAEEAKKWKIINLPMIAGDDDPLGRKPGELLWPERFDADFVRERQRLDPLGFSALYQQRPTVEDGVMFRRENIESRFYGSDDLPSDLRIFSASDHAVGLDPQRHDASVLLTVGVDRQNHIWLLDCYWERAPTDRVVEAMLAMAAQRKPIVWWAERGHISKSIGPFLRKRMLETGTFINVQEVTPAANKEQRAQSIAARLALGYVHWPRNAPWVDRAIEELLKFPNGTHDDFVDAFAYIGLGLGQQFGPARPVANDQPRYGTLGWLKRETKANERVEKMRKLARGF
jgi:predicted phage terminase large subunit-like protein